MSHDREQPRRASTPEKPPIPAKGAQAGLLHHILRVGAIAGQPARKRVGLREVRQHHAAAKACLIVLAAEAAHARCTPVRSCGGDPTIVGFIPVLRTNSRRSSDARSKVVSGTVATFSNKQQPAGCGVLLRSLHVAGIDEAAGLSLPQRGVIAAVLQQPVMRALLDDTPTMSKAISGRFARS